MALDIVEMEAEEFTCPHCGKPVLMRWQQAYFGGGEYSPQFLGLEKAASAEALRNKTYHRQRKIKSPPKSRPTSL